MEAGSKNQDFDLETDGGDIVDKSGIDSVNETAEIDNDDDNDNATTPMLNGKTEPSNKITYQVGDCEVEVVSY